MIKISFPISTEVLPSIPLPKFEVKEASIIDVSNIEVDISKIEKVLSEIDMSRVQTKRSNSGTRSYTNSEITRFIKELGGKPRGKKDEMIELLLSLIEKNKKLL